MLKEFNRQTEKVPTDKILETLNMKPMIVVRYNPLNKIEKQEPIYT